MADTKISEMTENTAPAGEDLVTTVDDPSGTPASRKTTLTNLSKAINASNIATGTLKHERGGLEADVSAYSGLVKITGGSTAAATIGIADDNIVEVDDADAADDDYAKFTAAGLEGRSYAEVKTDLSLDSVENTAISTWAGSANITTVGTVSSGDVDAAVSAASATTAGKSELATVAELEAGTDTGRTITPDVLAGSNFGERVLEVTAFDYTTDCAAGDGAGYVTVPSGYTGMNLVAVHARCITAGTTGTMDIQIHNLTQAADMLSTVITIDSTETGSDTAATPAVIDTANDDVASYDLLRVDLDAVHTTAAKGLIVVLEFRLP